MEQPEIEIKKGLIQDSQRLGRIHWTTHPKERLLQEEWEIEMKSIALGIESSPCLISAIPPFSDKECYVFILFTSQ